MLVVARPDWVQLVPLSLTYTPRSVPATMSERAKPKARTLRPSRPPATFQCVPPSVLIIAPPPCVPASSTLGLKLLYAMVRIAAVPQGVDLPGVPAATPRYRPPPAPPAVTSW